MATSVYVISDSKTKYLDIELMNKKYVDLNCPPLVIWLQQGVMITNYIFFP